MWPEAFQTSMDDCNDDRCPGLSDMMDRCHLRDEHPGVHDFEGKSHLESQHPVSQQMPSLLELAHVIICNGRAWDEKDHQDWETAKRKWIDLYHIWLDAHLNGAQE